MPSLVGSEMCIRDSISPAPFRNSNQPLGHIKRALLPRLRYVTYVQFYRGKSSAFSLLVDSRRILRVPCQLFFSFRFSVNTQVKGKIEIMNRLLGRNGTKKMEVANFGRCTARNQGQLRTDTGRPRHVRARNCRHVRGKQPHNKGLPRITHRLDELRGNFRRHG